MRSLSTARVRLLANRRRNRGRSLPDLKRSGSRRESRQLFVLFCEGRNTEPAYFEALKRVCRSALVEVETHPGVGVPYTIATEAVKRARELGLARRSRRKKESFEKHDQVWAVFDRDEHPRYNEAVEFFRNSGVHLARSGPCFELWLILHERDYDRPCDRHEVQTDLANLRPEYEAGGAKTPNCDELIARVDLAEERATILLKRRVQQRVPYGNPSTTVGCLTRAIRKANEGAR